MFRKSLFVILLLLQPLLVFAQEDQTFTSEDGKLTFQYPAGWALTEDSGFVALSNDAAALESSELLSGQVGIVLLTPDLISVFFAEAATGDLMSAMQVAIENLTEDDSTLVKEPELTEVNSNPAVQADFTRNNQFQRILLVDNPGGRFFAFLVTPLGEEAEHFATFETVISSLSYDPGATLPPVAQAGGAVVWQVTGAIDEATESGTELEKVLKLDVAADGTIYAANGTGGIVVLDGEGAVQQVIPVSVEDTPANVNSVAVGADGSLWVADPAHKKVLQVSAEGEILQSFGSQGAEPGQFTPIAPSDVQLSADGNIYAFDPGITNPAKIIIFAPDGTFEREIVFPDESFYNYEDFAIAPDGKLYVSVQHVTTTERIEIYEADGSKIAEIPIQVEDMGPLGALIVLEDGTFYATDAFNATIYHFDREGAVLWQFGVQQASRDILPAPGEFSFATGTGLNGLAILGNGDLLAGDMNDAYAQIVRITPE